MKEWTCRLDQGDLCPPEEPGLESQQSWAPPFIGNNNKSKTLPVQSVKMQSCCYNLSLLFFFKYKLFEHIFTCRWLLIHLENIQSASNGFLGPSSNLDHVTCHLFRAQTLTYKGFRLFILGQILQIILQFTFWLLILFMNNLNCYECVSKITFSLWFLTLILCHKGLFSSNGREILTNTVTVLFFIFKLYSNWGYILVNALFEASF